MWGTGTYPPGAWVRGSRSTRPLPEEIQSLVDEWWPDIPNRRLVFFRGMTKSQQLDVLATHIIARAGAHITSPTERMELWGVLHPDSYRRRLEREVYSNRGTLDEDVEMGVFGREHVEKETHSLLV